MVQYRYMENNMDYTQIWCNFEKYIKEQQSFYLDEKFKYTNDNKHYTMKELYCEACNNLKYISLILNMSMEKIIKNFSYKHYLLHCNEKDFKEKTQHLKNIFKDNYFYIIKASYDHMRWTYDNYKGLYGDNNIYEIDNKIEWMKNFFGINKNQAVNFMLKAIGHIYLPTDKIIKHIQDYADFLEVSIEDMKKIYINIPELLHRPLSKTIEKANGISELLQCSIKEVKKRYIIYPQFLFLTKSDIKTIFTNKKNQTLENIDKYLSNSLMSTKD